MPFYLRKSIKAGPFRFNLSKSGLGLSVGVKGFRVGSGPRGHYVHAGRGGLYYRASLGGAGRKRPSVAAPSTSPRPPTSPLPAYSEEDRVEMVEIGSGDVETMRASTVEDLLSDITRKQAQLSIGTVAAVSFGGIGLLTLLTDGGSVGLAALLAAIPALIIGKWLDSYKRTSVLFYKLEEPAQEAYAKVADAFDKLAACSGKWYILARGDVRDMATRKRNAGVDEIVRRKAASLTYRLPRVLRSNITPPTMTLGDRTFYFFPEVAIIKHGRRFGAVGYDDLIVKSKTMHFVWDGGVQPSDAAVVGHTWQHPNKSGGPDRRFARNRQLPLLQFENMYLLSESGICEYVQFSRVGVVEPFADSLQNLPRQREATNQSTPLEQSGPRPPVDASETRP